jgi:hypothetical protein
MKNVSEKVRISSSYVFELVNLAATQAEMAQKMRVLYPARKEGIKNTGPPSGRSFGSSDSSSSNADISSTGSQ